MLSKKLYVYLSKFIDKLLTVKNLTVKCCVIHPTCSDPKRNHPIISHLRNSHLISNQLEDLDTSSKESHEESKLLMSFLRKQLIQLLLVRLLIYFLREIFINHYNEANWFIHKFKKVEHYKTMSNAFWFYSFKLSQFGLFYFFWVLFFARVIASGCCIIHFWNSL